MLNILLVEDDRDLASSIIDHLELEQIICDYATNGLEAAVLVKKNSYHAIILDINMQEMDGLTLCKRIRDLGNDTPILMLTARDTLANKLEGFSAGSDDYMVKPFDIEELLARLYVLSKRRSGQVSVLESGPLSLNLSNLSGKLNDEPIKLTPTTFKLLETLMRASPNPVSQSDLIQSVWGDEIPDSNKLRVHIYNLRKVLSAGNAEHLLKTVPGYGFCITG
ncbi:MAG: response regulator transcription factor [Pseudomonadales bacterium]|jgi:DNA-binding response OmpR family regulator